MDGCRTWVDIGRVGKDIALLCVEVSGGLGVILLAIFEVVVRIALSFNLTDANHSLESLLNGGAVESGSALSFCRANVRYDGFQP